MRRLIIEPIVFMLMIVSTLVPAQGNIHLNTTSEKTSETGDPLLADDVEWWPMFHHDVQLTGYTPGESPDTNYKLWDSQIDNEIFSSSPAIVNDKLVIGTGYRYKDRSGEVSEYKDFYNSELFMKDKTFFDIIQNDRNPSTNEIGKIYCLNAKSGAILWGIETNGSVFSSPVIDNGRVYFVSADSINYTGELYCLSLDSGAEVWSLSVMTGFATPTLSDGKIYLLTVNPVNYFGRLQCLDATDGHEIWNHTTGYIDFSLYTAPALADGKVFFTSIDVTTGIHCKISCLNQSTGQLLWATKMSEMNFGYALSSPVIDNQKAYVISADTIGTEEFWCVLTCFDTSNGSSLWNYTMKENTKNELAFGCPAVAYGNVYFASTEENWNYGKMICLNGENGTVQWIHKSNDVYMISSPVISSGKVFVGGVNTTVFEGNLYCYDAYTGDLLYTAFVDNNPVNSAPAIADNAIYLGAVFGKICAFKDIFKVGEIKGGLLSVKTDIMNVGDEDIQDLRYTISVVGGLFNRINTSVNNTIEVLEAQTSDSIKVSPIFGLGKIEITITVELEGVNPVIKKVHAIVFGIFVIIR
jgi:outer membrane protein assembly factor BamB